jgi:RND family efflux transporter MFP subunit
MGFHDVFSRYPGSPGRSPGQWAALVLSFGFTSLLIAGCGRQSAQGPQAPEVTVARVLERTVKDWDEFTGRFEAIDTVEIRPRISGYVDKVEFREGNVVRAGDILVRIDPKPYQAELDRARAELARAETARNLAEIEVQRVEALASSGAVSREELDQRRSAAEGATAAVAAARAAADLAALNRSYADVRSPISGRASAAAVTRGNLVTGGATGGSLLTTVVSLDPIYVYFEGDEAAYLRYNKMAREGGRRSSRDTHNPVQVGLSDEEGWPHSGYVDFVDNQLNPRTGTLRARAVLDNRQGLFTPGLFARVRLLGSADYRAMLVEDRAIGTDQGTNYVLVVTPENKVEYRKVAVGRQMDGLRIVREGLSAGDQVIVSGLQRARPGSTVVPHLVEMASGDTAQAPLAAANGGAQVRGRENRP